MREIVLALMVLAMPTGCEKAAADRSGQLVARVNGIGISMQPPQAGTPAAAAQLERIIERELLVQRALAAHLDRDPQVQESIESARRQVLAQAYLEKSAFAQHSAAGSSCPGERDAEVRAFYQENPALFAERRVYRLRELAVPGSADMVEVVRTELARARGLDALAAWLRGRNAGFRIEALTQPAEQLPLAYLPQLARMKPGEVAVFATPAGASVIELVQAEHAPLAEAQAAPLIEQFLAGRRRLETAAAEVKRLRELATIEYLGEFKRGH
jgi:EpsD family peptidyl-prolyl cis-trans isomerase